MAQTVGITGGTGFIGSKIVELLVRNGYRVVVFTRNKRQKSDNPQITYACWNPGAGKMDRKTLSSLNAMINLAGAGIADKRWRDKRKKEIVDSRVKGTSFLVSNLRVSAPNCTTFISASAIGFYGYDNAQRIPFTETDPPHDDFLGKTCMKWENEAQKARDFARVVILRFGIVLGKDSGAFPQFAQPMSFGVIPILGYGQQVLSWIEVTDLVRLISFALDNPELRGVYNAVAPHPVTQQQLMSAIADTKSGLKIPVHVPAFLLKILLGEMSSEVLKSCTVSGQKIIDAGFTFQHPEITGAVKAILGE